MGRLERYLEKRDFAATPEPREAGRASQLGLRYSMQKHEATRTHFDLRLEWDDVLLSWAVTRGPSLRPADKRLAVRTEDHPLSYLAFEGPIPKGNYGAGTVMLFDIGHWQPLEPVEAALKAGQIRFRLHGRRLTGGWHLVRMRGGRAGDAGRDNWLLIKDEDEAAGRRDPVARYSRSAITNRSFREIAAGKAPVPAGPEGPLPRFHKPQLATLVEERPSGDEWWHEVKFDGYRALVALGRGGPRVFTRNGHDWSDRFAALLPAFDALDCSSALIDGEIVAGAGLEGFSALQKAIKAGGPFRFYGFDLLRLDGRDLTGAPLEDRRAALETLFAPAPPLGLAELSPVIRGDAAEALATICAAGGEGIISKRRDLPYRGRRTRSWLKVKCGRRDEFVILGWQKSDSRTRPFASLALGAYRDGALTYVGKVGTGFDTETMAELARAMAARACRTPPADVPGPDAAGLRWVRPELVAEVKYAETTAEGRLRQAVFVGLREDKPAQSVRIGEDRMTQEVQGRVNVAGIGISHPDRVVYPEAGVTKLEVARYYEAMADRILATAADRPLSLVRLPEGLRGERFFQKHAGRGFPEAVKSVPVTEADGKVAEYIYVSTAAGLVGAAQMGALEFHIWGARRDDPDRPDRMVFDLDPDEGLGFSEVISAAYDIRDRLAALDLPSWPLVTGGKGVHVVVPLRRIAAWETVKLYARLFATGLAEAESDRFTATMSKAKRKGRIFIDWLRNERGATAIAPFSLRARPGATVAVPVSWEELGRLSGADAFGLAAAQERDWSALKVPAAVGLSQGRVAKLEAWLGSGAR
ncbi:DNA ligase D [Celeribacter indicus]|uniref:DNA ligase (ATP) n=1 Tax=Celeribacter indicus TaxID=1208324 RepID=A0A0B5DZF4_9RHOB|nr:DNA ligase D [Celeribacter indicus]AJE48394.1 DNA polymerase LigD polymerase domain-containing protein [Celeribacter indicus]SDX58266.1 ATP-dependent DNA ligase LigD phosphoesterase module /ATP-dependent DNA ligase LigD polymerase module [Celeribacter indicus]